MPSDTSETQSKLQRKRERDRRSQRLARERTKARVASLESLVQDIVQQDTSGSNAMLIQEIAAVKEQRDQYAKALEFISRIATSHAQPSATASGELSDALIPARTNGRQSLSNFPAQLDNLAHHSPTDRSEGAKDAADTQAELRSIDFAVPELPHTLGESALFDEDLDSCMMDTQAGSQMSTTLTPIPYLAGASTEHVVLPYGTVCACSSTRCKPDNKIKTRWRLANESLGKSVNVKIAQGARTEEMNDDIPVRAVLEGWQSVMEFWGLSELPELWQILRGLDDAMFAGDTPAVERIAAYRLCYRRIQAMSHGRELPSWYRPRFVHLSS